MGDATKKCRVCGKAYTPCRSPHIASKVFRWQDVACSPECGAVYLERVMESRGQTRKAEEVSDPVQAEVPEPKTKSRMREKETAKAADMPDMPIAESEDVYEQADE